MAHLDFCILMTTLSLCGKWSLNQTFSHFSPDHKYTSRWTFWCLHHFQKPCINPNLSLPKWNLILHVRSFHFEMQHKPLVFCKPALGLDATEYYKCTQILVCQNSTKSYLRPFGRTPGRPLVTNFISKFVTLNFYHLCSPLVITSTLCNPPDPCHVFRACPIDQHGHGKAMPSPHGHLHESTCVQSI